MVQETGQPYAYTGDDPVNGVDPLGLYWGEGTLDKLRHDAASGADAVNNGVNSGYIWIDGVAQQTECGAVNNQGPVAGPLGCQNNSTLCWEPGGFAATLRSGSSAADAKSALEAKGVDIPSNYYASPSKSGNGWVFRPQGSTNDDDSIRVMEAGADPQYPNGYYRIYDSKGVPVDGEGNPLGNAGVGQEETHFPLDPDILGG
jgi:hypothetical protein